MVKRVSLILSYLLHPAFIPTIGVAVLLFANSHISLLPASVKNYLAVYVFLATALVPLALIPVFRYIHLISSITLSASRERIIPLFIVSAVYGGVAWRFMSFPASMMVKYFLLMVFFITLAVSLITVYWKISLHLVALGGLTGLFFLVFWVFDSSYFVWFCLALIAAGLAGTARLWLEEHTPGQVYLGFLLGFLGMAAPLLLMRAGLL